MEVGRQAVEDSFAVPDDRHARASILAKEGSRNATQRRQERQTSLACLTRRINFLTVYSSVFSFFNSLLHSDEIMDPIPGDSLVCSLPHHKTNAIPVVVKHQGKKYEVELDPTTNGETFKFQLYSLTGVEPERQKILVKGGQLKDETDLSKLGVKPGHTFMMMGTPSGAGTGIIEKPKEKIRFVEDMTEAEAAQSVGAIPAGLQNLGNTCYMNATIQTLKSIPELQQELATYSGTLVSSTLFR
jgi:hypothetical protein